MRGIPWQWNFYGVPGAPDGLADAVLRRGQTYSLHVYDDAPSDTASHFFSGISALGIAGGQLDPGGPELVRVFTPSVTGTFGFLCTDSSCGVGHDRMTGSIQIVP